MRRRLQSQQPERQAVDHSSWAWGHPPIHSLAYVLMNCLTCQVPAGRNGTVPQRPAPRPHSGTLGKKEKTKLRRKSRPVTCFEKCKGVSVPGASGFRRADPRESHGLRPSDRHPQMPLLSLGHPRQEELPHHLYASVLAYITRHCETWGSQREGGVIRSIDHAEAEAVLWVADTEERTGARLRSLTHCRLCRARPCTGRSWSCAPRHRSR
jgi:hypothetical protein